MKLSRRALLRGAGAAIALPHLEAHAAPPPRRFLVFFFGNGVNAGSWTDPGTGALPELLAPLEPLRSKLLLLNGVNMQTAVDNPGNGHNVGMTNLLTARQFIDRMATDAGAKGWGAGITLDQEIAKHKGSATRFPSLQLGVQSFASHGATPYSYLSYAAARQPIPAQDDPRKVFDRLFAEPVGGGDALAALRARQRSVLDLVREDTRALAASLGTGDRERLESHLEALRAIERRLGADAQPMAAASCRRPTALAVDPAGQGSFPAVGKLQMELCALAFACDLTRVATLQWSSAQSATVHSWSAIAARHHGLSHLTDATSMRQLATIQRWYMGQLAAMGLMLDKLSDGSGTLLDNTTILACSEVAVGQSHSHRDMPFLLLGRGGGALRTGQVLKANGASHNDLFVSLLLAMGIPATTFGQPEYCRGPLAGVLV